MVRNREKASTPGGTQVPGMSLLAMGLYGVVIGETIQLALRLWPGALENDLSWYPLLFALLFILIGSLMILASLLRAKVHVLLVIGVFLLSLLASYVQGKLFPTDASYWTTYWFLTYGGVVVLLCMILLSRVKGIWPYLWRTLLNAGVGAAIPITVMIVLGRGEWVDPLFGRDIMLISLVLGGLIPIVAHWFTTKRREHSLQG
jgi:hypothetical protein